MVASNDGSGFVSHFICRGDIMSRTKGFGLVSLLFFIGGLIAGAPIVGMIMVILAAGFAYGSSIIVSEQKRGTKW